MDMVMNTITMMKTMMKKRSRTLKFTVHQVWLGFTYFLLSFTFNYLACLYLKHWYVYEFAVYDSARVGHGSLGTSNLERPSVMAEDRYSHPVTSHGVPPPHVSTGAYGTNLSEPSGLGHNQGYGHRETSQEKWTSKVGQPIGMEEQPFAPNPTRITTPVGTTDHLYGIIIHNYK